MIHHRDAAAGLEARRHLEADATWNGIEWPCWSILTTIEPEPIDSSVPETVMRSVVCSVTVSVVWATAAPIEAEDHERVQYCYASEHRSSFRLEPHGSSESE